jgi:hypothetical protein
MLDPMTSMAQRGGEAASARTGGFVLVAVLLTACIFLQKLALPGTAGVYSLFLAVLPVMAFIGFATGVLTVDLVSGVFFCLFIALAITSYLISDSVALSTDSLLLLILLQAPFVFRLAEGALNAERLFDLFTDICTIIALFAVVQFAAQFVFGDHIAFFYDMQMPDGVVLKGFNILNPLAWDLPIYKSNGVFLLEPSLLSQLIAVAVVCELNGRMRPLRLAAFAMALAVSYSGTGLTMLALYLPYFIITRGGVKFALGFALAAAVGCGVLAMFSEALHLDTFLNRANEFSSVHSSGWARFISPFVYLSKYVFSDWRSAVFGRGPGTVNEYFLNVDYSAFDPTWAKILYEYGILGFVLYGAFFFQFFVTGKRGLRFPLGYTYFLLGGYLLTPVVICQMVCLVVWIKDNAAGFTAAPRPARFHRDRSRREGVDLAQAPPAARESAARTQ